jgi:hypothetical protein
MKKRWQASSFLVSSGSKHLMAARRPIITCSHS